MTKGTIILLNGTSSAGKSTVTRAVQEVMDEPYLHTGVATIQPNAFARLWERVKASKLVD